MKLAKKRECLNVRDIIVVCVTMAFKPHNPIRGTINLH
jgi:hypothetical protein